MTKLRALKSGGKTPWPPSHGYISISTLTPTSSASCSMLSCFSMQRRRRKERDQTTHTDSGLHPPLQASSSPAICARPSPCNSTTTRPWTSTEESIHHYRKREWDRERERKGRGGRGWRVRGGVVCSYEGEVRKSESEMPWNLITERVVSGRGGEQIKLA